MNELEQLTPGADEQPVPIAKAPDYEPWIEAVLTVAAHYRLEYSAENVRIAAAWAREQPLPEVLGTLARQVGLSCAPGKSDAAQLSPWRLPVVVQLRDGQVAVVETQSADGKLGVVQSGDGGLRSSVDRDTLLRETARVIVLRPSRSVPDARIDDYIKPYEPHWFRRIVLRDWRPYGHVLLASLLANTLGLAGILFTRQVYDRVVPAESMATLYVLFSGVLLALAFEFVLRGMRVRITDLLGKRADLRVSDRVFGHALRIRNAEKPRSTGGFIAQLRELEQVREMMTSSTVTAWADLPFFFLFCFILWHIAGPLVLVPMGAVVLLLIPGFLVQGKLKTLAGEAMRESALRNAMLVETIQGLEDVKALQAEQRFQQQWNHYNAVTSDVNLKLRGIASSLSVWTQSVQSAVFSSVVLFGAPMVMAGDLSVGALVAASILASRMMSPMSQVTSLMSRWQQAKVAMRSLDQLMERRVENADNEKRVHRAQLNGSYRFHQAMFQYPGAGAPALQIPALEIHGGERIAILGRNGAGKSTLLQALSGALEVNAGELSLDGVNLAHLDMADLRRDVGILTQNGRLFHGTIRENLLLGAPRASDEEIQAALALSGADDFVRRLPAGLDYVVMEGGGGMSGGQRQALLLARLFLRDPKIVLLDEPTASLDEASEKQLIEQLSVWLQGRTLIVATHRMSMLALADRVLVVEHGRILMDDAKSKVLSLLAKRSVKAVRKASGE
jgi:ATP-binding cassette subfamily C protein LapB